MKRSARFLSALVTIGLAALAVCVPAVAAADPGISGVSTHRGDYWGGTSVTVHGHDFTDVQRVVFGSARAWNVDVISSTTLQVTAPWHELGRINIRVVTAAGSSPKNTATWFSFTRPSMASHIQGGMTGRQEQHVSAQLRSKHHNVHLAPRRNRWTPAMGVTAMKRARSWLGLPYSWAGGNGAGPSTGVCAHNGGDLDCHIVGFDCSGLTMYAWWPYRHMAHYAATQKWQGGRFHPTIGQLMPGDLVFFSAYIPNGIGHVAIYEGHGMVVQAEESGTAIMESRLSDVIASSGSYRGAVRPMSTGKQGPKPQVAHMTSQLSTSGGNITISGRDLAGTRSVSVGGQMVYSFVQRTADRVVVKAPAHRSGKVTVAISNAWGTATRSLRYFGAPHVLAMSPAQGTTAGGNTVTLTGTSLAAATKVTVDSTAVKFTAGTGRLTFTAPAHAAGTATVTVYSRFGTSNAVQYIYLPNTVPTSAPPAPPSGSGAVPRGAHPARPSAPSSSPSSSASSSASSSGSSSPSPAPTSSSSTSGSPATSSSTSSASSPAAPSSAAPTS